MNKARYIKGMALIVVSPCIRLQHTVGVERLVLFFSSFCWIQDILIDTPYSSSHESPPLSTVSEKLPQPSSHNWLKETLTGLWSKFLIAYGRNETPIVYSHHLHFLSFELKRQPLFLYWTWLHWAPPCEEWQWDEEGLDLPLYGLQDESYSLMI